ncbi:metallohydrolase [Sphingomonas sp. dw_22]|uniref:ComEC/Rec2 family competence protein n=1 Tax=Sphingomonas sp. dw_22 TaxID=2721175 RepID=UPI0031FF1300
MEGKTGVKFAQTLAASLCLALTGAAQGPAATAPDAQAGDALPPWQPGMLDIHHISTGSGNSAFFVLPDGTTMLFDAGDVDRAQIARLPPLKVQPPRPDASRRAGQWIADYVRQFMPAGRAPALDYALISHFHSDHFGKLLPSSPPSKTGAYKLTGIMDVAEALPIGTLIDRAAPDYRIPVDLRKCEPGGTLNNYLAFVDWRTGHGMAVESIQPGKTGQIRLLRDAARYPGFQVRNVAANGLLWTGKGDRTAAHIPWKAAGGCGFNENPFSLALRITYGKFDYFTGGDITGLEGFGNPGWFDVETPLGAAVGPVDAMTLDHHGNRDATNANFLRAMQPRMIVQQNWVSDQPGGEVLHRMASPDIWPGERSIFSTGMADETRVAIGPWLEKAYSSMAGHVVLRVAPGGGQYEVFILDDTGTSRRVIRHFGPFASR